ncbi:preprotein translocase subunit SecG [Phaeovibrio sulfidiphilus]|uniref:Protein-export membrane protein SecG n=1 Tax=Phaeovibrio sulfidiphilus TaxID=1220600 RepID=A0A8J6YVT3_9PROT|nr:preprotein translocase subunit SecG [Phaeovibrio sulfidiphilus]MBE1236642.1 preprotein translocase subunit SecG [Phaeovibrio sulfidiphilus]
MLITVLLVIHVIVAALMIGLILMQRAEGGALGIGGGGGGMQTRPPANLLTRSTAILAAVFMILSLCLTLLSKRDSRDLSPILDDAPYRPVPAAEAPAPTHDPSLPAPPDSEPEADSWAPKSEPAGQAPAAAP